MERNALWAISPLDGRYHERLLGLERLVAEGGLIGYRIAVEAAWLLHLADDTVTGPIVRLSAPARRLLSEGLSELTAGVDRVKAIEATTNHDVKAVEYYLRERLKSVGADSATLAFIHFACTSEDINNLAYALMLRDVRDLRLVPLMELLISEVRQMVETLAAQPMLARTHGQAATPTTVGKELAVFGYRMQRQQRRMLAAPLLGKMNGAVGNYNAHLSAFPEVDWQALARSFVEQRLGLVFNPLTTQIENHDGIVEMVDAVRHFNTIAVGLCRDMWGYISLGYFRQRSVSGEVGSSTMPHKVNPIDFENAEGNLGLANAVASHFADKLPISRWQRDLSDSTVLRAIGTLAGHSELAYRSLLKGLGKVEVDRARLDRDLELAWEVLAEPVQTVMRRYGVVDAYERLKTATRGRAVTRETLVDLIEQCHELPDAVKSALKELTPRLYTGAAESLARSFVAGRC